LGSNGVNNLPEKKFRTRSTKDIGGDSDFAGFCGRAPFLPR